MGNPQEIKDKLAALEGQRVVMAYRSISHDGQPSTLVGTLRAVEDIKGWYQVEGAVEAHPGPVMVPLHGVTAIDPAPAAPAVSPGAADRVRALHVPLQHAGILICDACSPKRENSDVRYYCAPWPCPTITVLDDESHPTPPTPALRECLVPGCLRQYDAIATLAGREPARPEWSGKGWHTLTSGIPLPAGGHVCPTHVDLVKAHLPRRISEPGEPVKVRCACRGWSSPSYRWHGAIRGLWEDHLLQLLRPGAGQG